jgi:hypothetical protein
MNLDQFFRALSAVEPAAAEAREVCEAAWLQDPPPTLLAATIAKALVGVLDAEDSHRWSVVLDVVEEALQTPDDILQDVVATGFLEAAIAEAVRSGVADRLRRRLGPSSAAYVAAWEDFGTDV